MTIALPVQRAPASPSVWRAPLALLIGVAAALLLLFHADTAALAHLWWTSTTFGHCLFIGPVIGWLVWTRRRELARLTPVGWAPGLALVGAGGFGWLLGEAGGVSFARELGLVLTLQGAVVTLLGPNVARGLLFPIVYALFLVPFGEGLEGPLQQITVSIALPLLHASGVPASVNGVLITIPNGYFEVAEACSGDKFVLAMIAYGALVANVCFVSWARRAAWMALCVVAPVLANGVRAFATIYAAHLTSVARATGYDHIVYGWVFFALVMAACLAIGWRWFDRAPDDPAFDPAQLHARPALTLRAPIAAAAVIAVALVFPAWSAVIAGRAAPSPAHIELPQVAGWVRAPLSTRAPWTPYYPGADHFLFGRFRDTAGDEVDLAIALFARQREGAKLFAFGTGVLREEDRWVRVENQPSIAGGAAVRITAPSPDRLPVERVVANWYRVGDVTTASGAAVKFETLRANLLGGPRRALAIHLSAEALPGHDPRLAIERFARALGPLDRMADRVADGR